MLALVAENPRTMRVLVTGARCELARALVASLATTDDVELRLTDVSPMSQEGTAASGGAAEEWVCALGDDTSTAALVEGVDTIVHLEPLSELAVPELPTLAAQRQEGAGGGGAGAPDDAWLDRCTRCTYNLLDAAAKAGVGRVVLASSMEQFAAYHERDAIDTTWLPRPTCAPHVLGPHLAELILSQFVSVGATPSAAVLRIGQIADTTDSTRTGRFLTTTREATEALRDLLLLDGGDDEDEPYFYVGGGAASAYHPSRRRFSIVHLPSSPPAMAPGSTVAENRRQRELVRRLWAPPDLPAAASAGSGSVLVLGAGPHGLLGPHVVEELRRSGSWTSVVETDIPAPVDDYQLARRPSSSVDDSEDGQGAGGGKGTGEEEQGYETLDVSDKRAVWSAVAEHGAEALVRTHPSLTTRQKAQ